jgi:hypothetical protein
VKIHTSELPSSTGSEAVECRNDLLKIFFIEDESGLGNIAHTRKAAHEWFDALLDSLERGEGCGRKGDFTEDVTIEFKAMTQSELDALPEI